MNEKLRKGLLNLGLVVASVVVFFVIAEGYFAVFDPQIYKGPGGRLPFFQYDETLGWVNKPNAEGINRMTEVHKVLVKINSKGLRDREYEYDKLEGIKRIVVLGDSQTWGLGVEEREIFTEVLEDNLLKNVQVINMGVSGYGNDQEFLLLREEGVKYSPDVVIVAFCSSNDLRNNMHSIQYFHYKPMFVLDAENKLILTNVPVPQKNYLSVAKFLYTHSHTFHFLFDRLQSRGILDRIMKIVFSKEDSNISNLNYITECQYGYNLTKAILKEIDIVAKTNNSKTMIAIIPTCELVNKNRDSKINGVLVDFGKENNITVLDLFPEFRKHTESGEYLYFYKDSHLNSNGHKLVAELIYDKLIEEQLIPLGGEH